MKHVTIGESILLDTKILMYECGRSDKQFLISLRELGNFKAQLMIFLFLLSHSREAEVKNLDLKNNNKK